jgi:cytoskeletal protein RodZ
MVAMGLAALLLAGTGIGVAATRDPGDDTAAGSPSPVPPAEVTTTSTEPAPTTTSTPPTTVAVTTTTTTRRVTTTVARATTTKPSTTTTATAAVATCGAASIAVTIATDRPSYGPGEEVKVTSTLRNKSSVTCTYNGYGFTTSFRDEAGHTFGGTRVIADSFADVPFPPGQTITHTGTWDHLGSPPGVYTAVGTWNFGTATAEVTVTLNLR